MHPLKITYSMSKFIEITMLKTGNKIILNTSNIRVVENKGNYCNILPYDSEEPHAIKENYSTMKKLLVDQ